jgi:hypothetical protein
MALPRRGPQRSRKIIAWMFGVPLFLQALGGIVIDYAAPRIRFPELYAHLARLPRQPRVPELIVVGSSRFASFVYESELTHELRLLTGDTEFRALNCSISGGDSIVQERVLEELLSHDACPRIVVFETSPEFLNAQSRLFYLLHLDRQLNWEDMPRHLPQIVGCGAASHLFVSRCAPLYAYRYQILKQAGTGFAPLAEPAPLLPRDPMDEAEWNDLRLRTRPLTKEQRAVFDSVTEPDQPYLRDYRLAGNAPAALERALAVCQRRGIRPILVGAPAPAFYRSKYTPAIQSAYRQFLDPLIERLDVGYVELRDALPDHLFCDTHHAASPAAAIVFSRLLAREAVAPFLTSARVPARTVGFDKNQPAHRYRQSGK